MKGRPAALSITPASGKSTLSAGQKKFNALIKKIEKQRHAIEAWERSMPLYVEHWHSTFKPLLDQYHQNSLALLQWLDEASARFKLSKTDQKTLREEILALAVSLMDGENDSTIKDIYNRHSPEDYDTLEREENERLKQGYKEIFGFDLGDDVDLRSEEAIAQRLHEQLQAQHHEPRKPSGKTRAKQQRDEHDAKQASQSVREVYRKLASALHPDRATEAGERERRTALMQRVNQAYGERNLLALLHLQLEVEQIDIGQIRELPAERLKHYNRVLSEQLKELDMEVHAMAIAFMEKFALDTLEDITPQNMAQLYEEQLEHLRFDNENHHLLRQELKDPKAMKDWLKAQRQYEQELARGDLDRLFR